MPCLYIEIIELFQSEKGDVFLNIFFGISVKSQYINSSLTNFHRKDYPVLKVSNQNKLQNYIYQFNVSFGHEQNDTIL